MGIDEVDVGDFRQRDARCEWTIELLLHHQLEHRVPNLKLAFSFLGSHDRRCLDASPAPSIQQKHLDPTEAPFFCLDKQEGSCFFRYTCSVKYIGGGIIGCEATGQTGHRSHMFDMNRDFRINLTSEKLFYWAKGGDFYIYK